jgi:YegS/Rv2252/BmrU family lipid kinase
LRLGLPDLKEYIILTTQTSNAKTFIVLNPVAGTSDPDEMRYLIATKFTQKNVDYKLYVTTGEENLSKIVEEEINEGYQRVLAIGGDGTVSMTASALVGKNIPLGIIPAGTGNVLAQDLKIPLDIRRAMDLALANPAVRSIDAMKYSETYYFLNIGTGVTSSTLATMDQTDKRRFGVLAYIWQGIPKLVEFQSHRFQLTLDGVREDVDAVEVMVVNAGTMGMDPFTWDRDVAIDDGSLGVCVVKAKNIAELPRLAVDLATGKQRQNPNIACFSIAEEVKIESTSDLPVQADGELIGSLPVKVRVVPKALPVIVPEKTKK